MQFQYPGFLYFLFLLVIPIIVHLFQLRKFQKTPFTNVAFLKKVTLQARKSSQIKKWLTLLARLLALASIILAFAQPFVPKSDIALEESETLIYLDNSFSMELNGKRGPLLKRAVQDLLESLSPDGRYTILTNEEIYRNRTLDQLKRELLQLDYSTKSPLLNSIFMRAENEFSSTASTRKELVAISDFQENSIDLERISRKGTDLHFIQLLPENTDNVSIDSVSVSEKGPGEIGLSVQLSHSGKSPESVSLSLFDGSELLAKTGVDFGTKKTTNIQLDLNKTADNIEGKISLEDQGLAYDNSFYFSIGKTEKTKVVTLNNADGAFLKKIYAGEGFDFSSFSAGKFDYNEIIAANTLILNELDEIPTALLPVISRIVENGGHLVVIPPKEIKGSNYRALMENLQIPHFSKTVSVERDITEIVFAHPLYQNVFEDQVDNFQYPNVESSHGLIGNSQSILKFADGEAFLVQDGNTFVFAAALNTENTNFQQSPLIVPTFYAIAKQSLGQSDLYYTIGEKSEITVKADLGKDEILRIENESFSFVPIQKNNGQHVEISVETLPEKSGIYEVSLDRDSLRTIAFNYDRKESDLSYMNLQSMDDTVISTDVATFFAEKQEKNEIGELWKWFVIFALSFLLIEVLLLKYLK